MFDWIMTGIGLYAQFWQRAIMGEPPAVTRDRLGHLGKKERRP